jgi:hypothetical protein
MKKALLTLATVMMLLSTLAVPALAEPPTAVAGFFDYTFDPPVVLREADGNVFIHAAEHEEWQGSFVGTGEAEFTVGMFSSGFRNVWLRSTFTGTVGDKEGTMVLQLVGKRPAGEEWYGQWVIISGTGDLSKARGQGTWGGPGSGADEADIWYSGQIHFAP